MPSKIESSWFYSYYTLISHNSSIPVISAAGFFEFLLWTACLLDVVTSFQHDLVTRGFLSRRFTGAATSRECFHFCGNHRVPSLRRLRRCFSVKWRCSFVNKSWNNKCVKCAVCWLFKWLEKWTSFGLGDEVGVASQKNIFKNFNFYIFHIFFQFSKQNFLGIFHQIN